MFDSGDKRRGLKHMNKKFVYEVKRVIAVLLCSAMIVSPLSVETMASDDVIVEDVVVEESSSSEESAPVEESAPTTEAPAQVEESAPAEENVPAEESAPTEESTPVEEIAPVEEVVLVEESAPVEENAPVEESALAEENAPVEESASAEESAPVEEAAPVEENVSAEESAPVEENTSVEEIAPVEEIATPVDLQMDNVLDDEAVAAEIQEEPASDADIETLEDLESEPEIATETIEESNTEEIETAEEADETLVEVAAEASEEALAEVVVEVSEEAIEDNNLQKTLRSQTGRQGEYPDDEIDENEEDNNDELKKWYLVLGESIEGVKYKPTTTVIEDVVNGLNYIIAGVTTDLSSSIKAAISEIMSRDTTTPLVMIANKLIDADKYSTDYDGYDSKHCWIGAGSNSLWNSGWASYLKFSNEDEVMTYITKSFTDYGANQVAAWEWIFDGLYDITCSAQMKESTSTPLATDVYIESAIGKTSYAEGQLTEIGVLEKLNEYCAAMAVGWRKDDKDELANNSHALTALGVIYDSTVTNLKDRYKAIILADPDDDESEQSTSAPESDEAAYQSKLNKANKYGIYKLGTEVVNGVTYWTIIDYVPGISTYILSFDTLKNFSEDLLKSITEKEGEGTKDFKNNYDFSITDANLETFDGNEYVSKEEFCGEPLELWINFKNYSYKTVSSKMVVPIEVEVTSKKTNKTVKKILNGTFSLDTEAFGEGIINVDLAELGLSPDDIEEYELTAIVNPIGAGGEREAYYINNRVIRKTFKLIPSKGGCGDIPEEEPVIENEETTNEDADNAKDTENHNSPEIPSVSVDENVERFYAEIGNILANGSTNYYVPARTFDPTTSASYDVFVSGGIENVDIVMIDGVQIPKELLSIVANSHNVLRISIPAGMMKGLTKGVHTIKLYLKNRITPIEIEIEVV